MENKDFSVAFETKRSQDEVFELILDVRRWWTGLHNETIEGDSNILGKEFTFRAGGGMHYSKHRLIESMPFERISWKITDAELSFVKDGGEWIGTKVCFDISSNDGTTKVLFTHEGLVPELECYNSCSTTWSRYINEKLKKSLSGQEGDDNQLKNIDMEKPDFTSTFLVQETPEEVFTAINNPRAWWGEEITGTTDKLNEVFDYHFEDIHACKLKIIELMPAKKVVWHILENNFKFIKDKTEWINTSVVFDIAREGEKTKLVFTHLGLVPEYECYDVCHQGWTHYIQTSLKNFITTGGGKPNRSGVPQTETEKKLSSW